MEDRNEHNFDHGTNQSLLHVNEPFIHVKPISDPLLIDIEFTRPIQSTHVYIFPNTFAIYAQHESLKQITFLFNKRLWLHNHGLRLEIT